MCSQMDLWSKYTAQVHNGALCWVQLSSYQNCCLLTDHVCCIGSLRLRVVLWGSSHDGTMFASLG